MAFDVRLIRNDEFGSLITIDSRAFGITYTDEAIEHVRMVLELDRTLVAIDDPDVVGSASAFSLELTVPGGAFVPTAGVTWVGVMPSHRRRGILRRLMARQLDDIAERGEPLAALSASEGGIYARFGYGAATQRARLAVSAKRVRFRDAEQGHDGLVRFADAATARKTLPGIYERFRAVQPGTVSRHDAFWDHLLADPPSERGGASAQFFLIHPDGFAVYRRRHAPANGFPNGEAIVAELVAVTPQAHAALWRFLFELDLVETVVTSRYSPDDPLPWLLADRREARTEAIWDDEWVRVVHVPRALEARRYLAEGRLVLEVVDGFRPATGGRFELDGGPDGAICKRTTAEPDLVMDAGSLGSIYLGGVRPTALLRARRIEERARRRGAPSGPPVRVGPAAAQPVALLTHHREGPPEPRAGSPGARSCSPSALNSSAPVTNFLAGTPATRPRPGAAVAP